jgi:signal transduction histidine kinase
VDVSELAEQCAAVVRPLAEAQGLRLSVSSACTTGQESADSSTQLTTDPDKLREVLNNLLHNAIQYNRPAGQINLSVARDNGNVRLEVRDTGIGIAPEARELIFERFYRADPSRTGDGMNAGLGLAIVKEYVELMGGRIFVDSAPGQGSTFRVDLPAMPAVSL